jgi:hypothetical protein
MQIFENSLKTNNFTGRRQHTDVQNSAQQKKKAKHRGRKVMEAKREKKKLFT